MKKAPAKKAIPPVRFTVRVDAGAKGKVTALAYRAAAQESARATLILGHGAGADQRHAFLVGMAKRLRDRGVDVVTYNFLYTEQKRRLPDRNDALERCVRAVVHAVRAQAETRAALFLGGKSMGGRIASQVAASGDDAAKALAGLVFLGYPLHPPGRPEKMRDAHLVDVRAPMLFVQGARDAFGTPAELAPILAKLPRARLHPIDEGDHSLVVPKRLGIAQETIYDDVADVIAAWIFEVAAAAATYAS